jgi:hypothetical protein
MPTKRDSLKPDSSGAGTNSLAEQPSHADIAARAYERFLARGAEPGHDVEDWLEAERGLREETKRLTNEKE